MLWALWCTLSVTLIHCRQRTRSWFNDWGLLQSVFLAVLSCASWFFWPELRPCNPRCIPCITKPVSYSFAFACDVVCVRLRFFYAVQGMRREMYTSHAITHRISSLLTLQARFYLRAKGTENLAEENSEQSLQHWQNIDLCSCDRDAAPCVPV